MKGGMQKGMPFFIILHDDEVAGGVFAYPGTCPSAGAVNCINAGEKAGDAQQLFNARPCGVAFDKIEDFLLNA